MLFMAQVRITHLPQRTRQYFKKAFDPVEKLIVYIVTRTGEYLARKLWNSYREPISQTFARWLFFQTLRDDGAVVYTYPTVVLGSGLFSPYIDKTRLKSIKSNSLRKMRNIIKRPFRMRQMQRITFWFLEKSDDRISQKKLQYGL